MPRLRVCLIATHFAEYSNLLAQAIARSADVMVVANRENVEMELGREFDARNQFQRVLLVHQTKNPFSLLLQAFRLAQAVRRFAPDIIHVQEDSKDVFAIALHLMPVCPVVLTMHDPKPHAGADTVARQKTRRGFYIAQLRRRADAVIVHGMSLVADAEEAIGQRPVTVHVIPHGPLGQIPAERVALPTERGRCLFFGRMEAYKGLDIFIDVIERLHSSNRAVRGVVAGRGSSLDALRGVLEGDERFEVIDRFLSPEEALQEFQRAEVVVMPYREATQSGIAAFAMGVGRPVVGFDVGAVRESVEHGETGLLVASGDVDALTTAVSEVLNDATLRHRLGRAAHARGKRKFAWDEIGNLHFDVYQSLLRGDIHR
ncbi:glycosyltransferase [Mycolicibacterium gilvum Spyr1]|uniref:Glycosyltransferase n=1 Tax=Mycolicibacterium gilvum (strain DSM 45189 / LMG 24558 / Spyr1) TaxID=278137 RepID=E6TAQ3_MYCSR|nr:glycosyltransferase [Mycolicibacterium gilvum Spyr1]